MIGMQFIVSASNCDEISEHTDPENMTMDIAARKAEMAHHSEGDIVIGADTVVVLDREVLGKPNGEQGAVEMLKELSGRTHQVYTGVCIIRAQRELKEYELTEVRFREMTAREIEAYVDTKEPMDKAGAYGAQGKGALFVESIDGDFFNVMGLPVCRLGKMLNEQGVGIL